MTDWRTLPVRAERMTEPEKAQLLSMLRVAQGEPGIDELIYKLRCHFLADDATAVAMRAGLNPPGWGHR